MQHMKIIQLLLVFLSNLLAIGQIELSQSTFDLGEISLLNSDIIDFNVENISSESVFLLRIEAEENVGFQYTSNTFKSGEKEGIRIKLNPDGKGKIERTVQFYFSNNSTPVEIKVKAVVKDLPKNNRTACPQFGSSLKPPNGKTQPVAAIQSFNLILYDAESKKDLHVLHETQRAEEVEEVKSEIETSSEAIKPQPAQVYSAARKERPIKNKKSRTSPENRRDAPSLGSILFGKVKDTTKASVEDKAKKTVQEEKPQLVKKAVVLEQKETVAEEQTIPPNLLDQSYKPNNIVFLIDASTSMREEQKMEILKKAMVELLGPLREIDYITIVTYSGEAKVVLATSKGNLKTEIKQQIEELEADGSTNAVKGIKKAILVGKNNFLANGNNQIFLASDGAFNIGENNMSLRRKIKKTAEDGLTITVLGIKNESWTNKSLKEIATLGNGDLIKIKSMRDAGKVLQSMKRKASR